MVWSPEACRPLQSQSRLPRIGIDAVSPKLATVSDLDEGPVLLAYHLDAFHALPLPEDVSLSEC